MKSSKLRIIKVWWRITLLAGQSQLINTGASILFLIGKLIRFLFFFVFLFQIVSTASGLGGYNKSEILVFFLVFNLIDILTQFLFRGVYHFRPLIISGDYDLDLLKPMPAFFRPIFGWTDVLDLFTFIPLSVFFVWYLMSNNIIVGLSGFLFLILFFNSLLIAFSFHLFVCAVCVLTTEIDHLIWVYRDLTNMARFSTDIYPKAIRTILTFTIPVVILMTVPAKGLIGVLSWQMAVLSFIIGALFLFASLKFWKFSLKRYTSASS